MPPSDRTPSERDPSDPEPSPSEGTGERPVEVVLAHSGTRILVEPGRSILDAILEHGALTSFACEQGECGLCTVRVLEGSPRHRDKVLTDEQRAGFMCTCVSWADSDRLVLDL